MKMIKNTELNWRDAKKELPTLLVEPFLTKCCLLIININSKKTMKVEQCIWVCGEWRWAYTSNENVTHWIYLDEIPLPEE